MGIKIFSQIKKGTKTGPGARDRKMLFSSICARAERWVCLGSGRSHYSTLACEDRLAVGVVMEVGSRLDFISLPSSLRDP